MSLVTLADLTAAATSNPARKIYQLVGERVQERTRPMPPDPTMRLSDASIGVLQGWIAAGAQPGQACATGTTTGPVAGGAASSGAAGSGMGQPTTDAGAAGGSGGTGPQPGGVVPSDADIETCYELRAHGQATPGDKTRYTVPVGETYSGFIFKAPWTKPVQGLRFRHLEDNGAVLHHWLLYSEAAALAGPTGFLCGQAATRSLITGWAPGRGDVRLPADVGLELPAPGTLLAVELHYYNNGTSPAQDQSGVEICVTSKFRKNTASITWLGTHQINIPGGTRGMASGTCKPLRAGMNATDPINVLFSWPHMHKLGTHLTTVVNRAGGTKDVMHDLPFSFEFQALYDTPIAVRPGDTLTTTCTFQNSTPQAVSFGQSTNQEMCYNFVYAWPAHALDNPGAELGGAANTCLH
jgi:hypothetical protein